MPKAVCSGEECREEWAEEGTDAAGKVCSTEEAAGRPIGDARMRRSLFDTDVTVACRLTGVIRVAALAACGENIAPLPLLLLLPAMAGSGDEKEKECWRCDGEREAVGECSGEGCGDT